MNIENILRVLQPLSMREGVTRDKIILRLIKLGDVARRHGREHASYGRTAVDTAMDQLSGSIISLGDRLKRLTEESPLIEPLLISTHDILMARQSTDGSPAAHVHLETLLRTLNSSLAELQGIINNLNIHKNSFDRSERESANWITEEKNFERREIRKLLYPHFNKGKGRNADAYILAEIADFYKDLTGQKFTVTTTSINDQRSSGRAIEFACVVITELKLEEYFVPRPAANAGKIKQISRKTLANRLGDLWKYAQKNTKRRKSTIDHKKERVKNTSKSARIP